METGTIISDWNKLGAMVREARNDQGWSQSQLAERAQVSRAWIAKLEAGHRSAELEQILRLFSALNLVLLAQPAGATTAPSATASQVAQSRNDLAVPHAAVARLEASERRRDAWARARVRSNATVAQ
jgi:y4mF family transcriptional regulator